MNPFQILVTPIAELTEEQFAFLLEHRKAMKALIGSPEYFEAMRERSALEKARKDAAKAAAKVAAKERRRRMKDEQEVRAYLTSLMPV